MPLRTCLILTISPSLKAFGATVLGPLPGCQTNVRGILGVLLHATRLARRGARAIRQRARLDAALTGDLLDRGEMRQAVHRRAHHVVRIGRAEALRQNVRNSCTFHDRADCATGDHTGARRGGLHQNLARAMLADDFVGNVAAGERHGDHRAARTVDRLADGLGNFVRLARRVADAALAIADGNERVEREAASALHDLGDAIDRDDVLDQVTAFAVPGIGTSTALAATAVAASTLTRAAATT